MTTETLPARWLTVVAIVFAGINLRPAIVSVSPLLQAVQLDLSLSSSTAGLLISLPVLLLGISSPFAFVLVRRLTTSRAISLSLAVLALGILVRSLSALSNYDAAALWSGTVLIGVSLGVANALVPSVIKELPAHRRACSTAALSFAICLGGALAAGTAGPLSHVLADQWSRAFLVWALPALLCSVIWWYCPVSDRQAKRDPLPSLESSLFRHPLAIALCIHMGLQSFLSQSVTAWLPTILVVRGLNEVSAGSMLSMLMAAQLFTALGGVWLATRGHDQRVAVTVMYLVALGGFFGCMQAPPSWVVPSVILLGLGQGGTFSIGLLMIVLRANTSRAALRLASLTQFVGYTIASVGPWLFGVLRDYYGSWRFAMPLFLGITVVGISAALYAAQNRRIL